MQSANVGSGVDVSDPGRVDPGDFTGAQSFGELQVHLGALSNDTLGNLNPELTYEIIHYGTVRIAKGQCRLIE